MIDGTSEEELRRAARTGFAMDLIAATDRRHLEVGSVMAFLSSPIRLGQIAFEFGTMGQPLACVTWAYLTKNVSKQLEGDPLRLLDLQEWNEGDRLYIIDVISPYGLAHGLLSRLRHTLWSSHDAVHAIRQRADNTTRRVAFPLHKRLTR